jgi:RNA polymerase sigma factor for flagellar operon FliA
MPDSPDVLARVHEGLPLVDLIARHLRRQLGSGVRVDELVSFGREGLLAAARSFDPGLGTPFARWANYRVRGAMLDGVRQMSMLPRSVYRKLRAVAAAQDAAEGAAEDGSAARPASAEEADARLGSYLAGIATAVAIGMLAAPAEPSTGEALDAAPSAEDVIARGQLLDAVRAALPTLPDPERHLIQRHYFDDVQLDEAARELGLSKSWASRLHSRAIESITRHMKRTTR